MTANDGGNAFPSAGGPAGMSLRDWFAGQALAGMSRSHVEGTVDDYLPQFVAQDAYNLADAMLAARNATINPTN